MMKRHYTTWMMTLIWGITLSSCQLQDDLFGSKTEKIESGTLELSVLANAPVSMTTKADNTTGPTVDTKDFQVLIKGEEKTDGTTVIQKYDKVESMPSTIQLSVGKYTVTSNTPGQLEKKMSKPYYKGTKEIEITKNVPQEATVRCTMQNSRIQIKYSDAFKNAFKSWTMTLDDGSETALYFTNEDTENEVYWAFGEGVSQVRVNVTAETQEGSTIRDSRTFNKSMATEGYGDVNSDNFMGGDALVLDFEPSTNPNVGNVTGINLSLYITFTNYTDQVQIPVSDKEPELPSEPNTPSEPGEGPSLTCDKFTTGETFSTKTDSYPETKIVIATPNGLKSMKATIVGGNKGFTAAVEDMNFTDKELIGDTELFDMLNGLGVSITMPTEGVTNYIFPISAFYSMMNIYGPTVDADETEYEPDNKDFHSFQIVVEDKMGQTASATLNVTITK